MSEEAREQFQQPLAQHGYHTRLLSTEEAATVTGLSQYELRMGAKQGRYPAILTGSPSSRHRKLRWNLSALEEALQKKMELNTGREEDC